MKRAIEEFSHYLTINKGYSPRTAAAYSLDLTQIVHYLEKSDRTSEIKRIRQQDIVSFLASLSISGETGKPNSVITRARKLASIRSFLKYLVRMGEIKADPSLLVELPTLPEREPDFLTEPEYKKLLATVHEHSSPFFHARDVAIMTLFLTTGLRVSELVGLKKEDVTLDPPSIRLYRKRNKSQTIPLTAQTAEYLEMYQKERVDTTNPFVFLGKRSNTLTSNGVYSIVKKYLKLSNIHKAKYGPHTLRHTCFTTLVRNEVNPAVIQALAGHASFDTTRRYLHINDKQIQKAIETIEL